MKTATRSRCTLSTRHPAQARSGGAGHERQLDHRGDQCRTAQRRGEETESIKTHGDDFTFFYPYRHPHPIRVEESDARIHLLRLVHLLISHTMRLTFDIKQHIVEQDVDQHHDQTDHTDPNQRCCNSPSQ